MAVLSFLLVCRVAVALLVLAQAPQVLQTQVCNSSTNFISQARPRLKIPSHVAFICWLVHITFILRQAPPHVQPTSIPGQGCCPKHAAQEPTTLLGYQLPTKNAEGRIGWTGTSTSCVTGSRATYYIPLYSYRTPLPPVTIVVFAPNLVTLPVLLSWSPRGVVSRYRIAMWTVAVRSSRGKESLAKIPTIVIFLLNDLVARLRAASHCRPHAIIPSSS